MHGKGLLIAGVALLVVGLLGSIATGAFLASQAGRQAGRYRQDRSYDDRRDRSGESTDTTTAPPPRTPRSGPGGRFEGPQEFESAGERIWYTGIGAKGFIARDPAYGPSMMGGCAICHGEDGRGTRFIMMGREFDAPDIRLSRLTQPHDDDGRQVPAWTEADVARAVREGVEPDGERLEEEMPRWDISEEDLAPLLAYMREL